MKITGSVRLILLLLSLIMGSVVGIYIWLINYIFLLFSIGLFIVIVILYIVRLHNDSYRMVRRMIERIRFCGCTFSYFPEKGERQI